MSMKEPEYPEESEEMGRMLEGRAFGNIQAIVCGRCAARGWLKAPPLLDVNGLSRKPGKAIIMCYRCGYSEESGFRIVRLYMGDAAMREVAHQFRSTVESEVRGFTEPADRGFDDGHEVSLIASMLGEDRAVALLENE